MLFKHKHTVSYRPIPFLAAPEHAAAPMELVRHAVWKGALLEIQQEISKQFFQLTLQ